MNPPNDTPEKPLSKMWIKKILPFILIGIGLIANFSGGIIFAGPLLVFLAPDFLLVGTSLLILTFLCPHKKSFIKILIFILLLIVFGINTRIPSFLYDLLATKTEVNIPNKLSLSMGDVIHLDTNMPILSARQFPYDKVSPRCNEGFCGIILGFSPPATFLSRDYWREVPANSIISLGYSLAKSEQKAATLKIRAKKEGYELTVHQELLDDTGKIVASESRTYRNGFPFESPDLDENNKRDNSFLWSLEHLIHGNFVSYIIGHRMGFSHADPVGKFLNASIKRYIKQDDPKFIQMLEPTIESDEVMNPPLDYSKSDEAWGAKFNDKNRSDACKSVIQPVVGGSEVPDYSVESGIMGLDKMRRTFIFTHGKNGNERILLPSIVVDSVLCDGEFLYLLERTKNYSQYEISKYKYDGTFIYHVAFKIPSSIGIGLISKPSLKENNGQLEFEYVDFDNAGHVRRINRIRNMRLIPIQTQ